MITLADHVQPCRQAMASTKSTSDQFKGVWQLRGTATGHQVEGATVAVTANQGLFGHGSSVLLSR